MTGILLMARLLLAAVFGVAGVAKLVDREGSRQSARAFGVPAALAPAFAVVALWMFVLVALYQILRQNGRILRRLDAIEAKLGMSAQPTEAAAAGLAVDTAAPDFRLARLDGGTTTLAGLRENSKRLLLF